MLIYSSKVGRDSDRSSPVFALPDLRSPTFRTEPSVKPAGLPTSHRYNWLASDRFWPIVATYASYYPARCRATKKGPYLSCWLR
ncbi:hypothetical protein PSEUDO8BK_40805 [Pseudomonas sp. 8BK]|nr:hypothetical protein PSEUDO8BK_40805 [Pseudomonas sp. 8BK]